MKVLAQKQCKKKKKKNYFAFHTKHMSYKIINDIMSKSVKLATECKFIFVRGKYRVIWDNKLQHFFTNVDDDFDFFIFTPKKVCV